MARKQIDEHSLQVLEFEQVRRILASFAASSLGEKAASELYPSLDYDWIVKRQEETTELKMLLEKQIAIPLAGLRDIEPLIENCGRGRTVFEPGELLHISDTLAASGRIKKFLNNLPDEQAGHLHSMAQRLLDFSQIVAEISRCVEDEKKIRDNASEKLNEIRQQIRQLTRDIGRRFKSIVSTPELRKAIENEKMLMRHGRVVVAIKTRYRQKLKGIVLDRSNTGATLFVEPEQLVELSNELEETRYAEQKEVSRILWQLTHAILERKKDIITSLRTLSLFDMTFAKAKFSIVYEMSSPEISDRMALFLRQARHPLLLYCVSTQKGCDLSEAMKEVVPIDVRLGDDFDLLLVTGPNTGGKTVMLKTIGLLTLMAQSGLHIPAHPDSRIPAFRQIFADIGDEQSIEQSLSTFSAHISRIVGILRRTNDATLVLLDELGAGTDPVEGAVLATSILDKLLSKGSKVIATTHLGRLKSYAYTTTRVENASVQFDMQTLEPLYKVTIGTPGSSNALAIAERLGMPKAMINQAHSLIDSEDDGTSQLINQVQATREDTELKRSIAQEKLDQAEQMRAQAVKELDEIDQQRKMITRQANREIEKSMSQVRDVVGDFVSQMQNSPKPWSDHTGQLKDRIAQVAQSTPLAVRQAKFTDSVRKGDGVFAIAFKSNGIVYRINRKRKVFGLIIGSKQVDVPFSQVWEPQGQ